MSEKLKILFIGSIPPPYHGVTVQNDRLLKSKLGAVFEIIHLDTTDYRDLNNLGKIDFYNIYLGILHLYKLIRFLILLKPDIVYLTIAQNMVAFFRDGLFIICSKLFSAAKVTVHFRGANYFRFYSSCPKLFKKYINFVYSICDDAIVLGYNLKSMVSGWFSEKHTFVISEGNDFSVNLSKKKNNYKDVNIGYIGILAPEKGIGELLNAFKQLHDKYENLHLMLAGEFAYDNKKFKCDIVNYIKAHNLSLSVQFLGFVENNTKEDFFLNTDIFVFPSWVEGQPIAILEAMASFCPVVASDVGAISDSVIDGLNGYLVPAKSVNALMDKIEIFLQEPDKIAEMGINSLKLYKEKFTLEHNVNNLIQAFDTIGNH